jgi:hypothetical protein
MHPRGGLVTSTERVGGWLVRERRGSTDEVTYSGQCRRYMSR